MKRRIWTVAVGLASVAALIAVPSAFAAYTTAKLEVEQTGTTVLIKATLDPNDDPTASVRIFAPTGTTLTTNQAPGTVARPGHALVKALDLGGADVPLEGNSSSPRPGQVSPAQQAACLRSATPTRNLGAGAQRGRSDPAGTRVSRRDDRHADGARSRVHPGLPAAAGHSRRDPGPGDLRREAVQRRAHGQRRIQPVARARGSRSGRRTARASGRSTSRATIASPAAIAAGAVTVAARRAGRARVGATVTGRVTQGGQARAGATVDDLRRASGRTG